MNIELTKSNVVFNEIPHSYFLDGKELRGVTSILHGTDMFKDMYKTASAKLLDNNEVWKNSGYDISHSVNVSYDYDDEGNAIGVNVEKVPFSTLSFFCSDSEKDELEALYLSAQDEEVRITRNKFNASLRGIAVHKACEEEDFTNEHAMKYINMRNELGMQQLCFEYLVSDNDFVASQIDIVMNDDDGNISLADIKCVSKMDSTYMSYLQWQLSIYKYLFEMQNPGIKVKKLYGIWLPQKESYGKARMFELKPIDESEVVRLLECSKNGEKYECITTPVLPDGIMKSFEDYLAAKARLKADGDFVKKFESELLIAFNENGIMKWDFSDKAKFTRTAETEAKTFDAKAFEADHPELYAQYIKITKKKSSLRVTIK